MSIKEVIVDYMEHRSDVDKWVAIKGEQKYLRFANMLSENKLPVTWCNVSVLYRYDKRLLINIFKYMSFLEELLRALVWNISKIEYKELEKRYLKEVMDKVIKHKDKIALPGFSINVLEENYKYINYLRNQISHNKIVLECCMDNKGINDILLLFKNTLPDEYKRGFAKDINNCEKNLNIPDCLRIKI